MEKDAVANFIRRYRSIGDIKYIYDGQTIPYFEEGTLMHEINWNDVVGFQATDKWLYVFVKNPLQNIWIPRVTADKQELDIFEKAVSERPVSFHSL